MEQNQNQMEKNYFEIVINVFIERLIPFLTGEQVRLWDQLGQASLKVQLIDLLEGLFGVQLNQIIF